MRPLTFYPAFFATLLSVVCLSYLARKEHIPDNPQTLSMMAANRLQALRYFQVVLWVCGTLFAITMYFYLIPRISYSAPQAAAWSLTYFSEMLLAAIPASGKNIKLHNILSFGMGLGMLGSAYLFVISLDGIYAGLELLISAAMTALGLATFFDRKRFIFYELPFIYLAHISILIALMALIN